MLKPIFTALSPNTEWDDVWLALKLIFQPWKWINGGAVKELEQKSREYLGVKHAFAFSSGRGALYAILSALELKPDDEVLLQAYTCVAVPNAVIWAGAKPIYVDIDAETFNMSAEDLEKKISPHSRILIIQHTFGMPADVDRLLEIARAHDLFVIEDCAHALGAEYKGRLVGTFGHAAFFSFGRDKVISSVFGGMAVTNSDIVAEKLSLIYNNTLEAGRQWTLQQLLQPRIAAKAKLFYNFLELGKLILWVSRRIGLLSRSVERGEYQAGKPAFVGRKMPNALAELALRQFGKLERFNAHRREIVKIYENGLKTGSTVRPVPLRYILRLPQAAELIKKAKKENIFLGDWYNAPIAPRGVDYGKIGYEIGSCPEVERLASQSVNLPTDIHITEKDARRIIEFFKKNI